MSMKSIEDLERIFNRGITVWEGEILSESAEKWVPNASGKSNGTQKW